MFKPQSSDEIQKMIDEADEGVDEYDEENDGKDKNDKVCDELLEAIHEMGGIKVNLDQNANKACETVLKNAKNQKKKEEIRAKMRESIKR